MRMAAELREEADFLEQQECLAKAYLDAKGKAARFYSAQYQIKGSKRPGTFVGLCCKSCRRWEEAGHKEDCAVTELEKENV